MSVNYKGVYAKNAREMVATLNELQLKKENIVLLTKSENQYILIYVE